MIRIGWRTLEVLAEAGDVQAKRALLALTEPVPGVRVRSNLHGEIVIYRPVGDSGQPATSVLRGVT